MTKRFNPPRSLRAAITRAIKLVQEGWIRGAWQRTDRFGTCEYCLDGAIEKACTGDASGDQHGTMLRKVRRLVAREIVSAGNRCYENDSATIYHYNDAAGRVKAEVVSLLVDAREAAECSAAR